MSRSTSSPWFLPMLRVWQKAARCVAFCVCFRTSSQRPEEACVSPRFRAHAGGAKARSRLSVRLTCCGRGEKRCPAVGDRRAGVVKLLLFAWAIIAYSASSSLLPSSALSCMAAVSSRVCVMASSRSSMDGVLPLGVADDTIIFSSFLGRSVRALLFLLYCFDGAIDQR